MRNITNLPKEIFQNIVKDLEQNDLSRCQYVCKSWYRPFHLLFLKDITFIEDSDAEDFINAINSNPDPIYLNSVKSITSESFNFSGEDDQISIDEEVLLESLFFRFRNLEKVELWGRQWLLSKFNDALCQKLLDSCPKLDTFSVRYVDLTGYDDYYWPGEAIEKYYCSLVHVRFILTKMDAVVHESSEDYSTVEYVSQFPRLREMVGARGWFDNLQDWLPLLEVLPDYQSIYIAYEEGTNVAEDYLNRLPKVKQTKLLERLAKLPGLNLHGVLKNSLKFASAYMTGLDSFVSTSDLAYFNRHWSDLQLQCYFDKLCDLASTVRVSSNLSMKGVKHTFLSNNLPSITSKNFVKESSIYTNHLHFFLKYMHQEQPSSTDLVIESSKEQHRRDIHVLFKIGISVNDIGTNILTSRLDNVSTFELEMEKKDNGRPTLSAYYKILRRFPSLKSLILDIPASFTVDDSMVDYCGLKVEEVTIRASEDMNLEPVLNQFYHALPNIKSLSIYYCSGIWNQDSGQFKLDLSAYSLENLTVDLSPMKNKSLKFLTSQIPLDDHFFVVNVTNNGKQQMYQVSLDFSSVTKVDDDDLLGFECGIDFYQLNITIHNVHYLHLYINYDQTYYYKSNFLKFSAVGYVAPTDHSKTRVVEFDYGK